MEEYFHVLMLNEHLFRLIGTQSVKYVDSHNYEVRN